MTESIYTAVVAVMVWVVFVLLYALALVLLLGPGKEDGDDGDSR